MKRAKQKNLYEDKSDPMGDLDFQFDGDDDDIINLEDIIEMPDRPIDEDEDLDLDIEIFELDEELESAPAASADKSAGLSVEESAGEGEEEDLLGSFAAETDEEEILFEPIASAATEESSAREARVEIFDEDAESGLDDLLEQPDPSEELRLKQAALRARAEAALRVAEEAQPEEAQPEQAAVPSSTEAGAAAGVVDASISEISAAAEELIGCIESRLKEHIRVVVESMLPGLVRSIIDEETTKLQKELE